MSRQAEDSFYLVFQAEAIADNVGAEPLRLQLPELLWQSVEGHAVGTAVSFQTCSTDQ